MELDQILAIAALVVAILALPPLWEWVRYFFPGLWPQLEERVLIVLRDLVREVQVFRNELQTVRSSISQMEQDIHVLSGSQDDLIQVQNRHEQAQNRLEQEVLANTTCLGGIRRVLAEQQPASPQRVCTW